MSNLNDLVKAIAGQNSTGTAQAVDTVEVIGSSLGLLADLSGAIGFVTFAVSVIDSIVGKDKSLDDVLSTMVQLFAGLQSEIRAGQILEKMRDLGNTIADPEAILRQLGAMVREEASNDFRLGQIKTCLSAVIKLTDKGELGQWKMAYGDQFYYSGDVWSGPMAPQPDGNGTVFNYTYVLPLYLRAIYIFLTAVGTLTPKDLPLYSGTLRDCVDRLQQVHDTIVDGIVIARLPAPAEMWKTADPNNVFETYQGSPYASSFPNGQFLACSPWGGGQDPYRVYGTAWPFQLYGAVEIYSGNHSIASYPPIDVPPSGPPLDDAWMAAVQGKLALRVLKARKDIYAGAALPEVCRVANSLRAIVGDPAAPAPAIGGWTLLEIYQTLGTLARWGSDWQHAPTDRLLLPTPLLLQLRKYLETVPPTHTGPDSAHLSPYAPTSLRQMLTA